MIAPLVALAILAQSPPAGAAAKTGYPACDRYIEMVTACIRTRVPADRQAEERQKLDALRGLLQNSLLGPSLAAGCAENTRLEIQRDPYGCYAAQAAATATPTACSLIDRAELEQIAGRRLLDGSLRGGRCTYGATGPGQPPVAIEVHWRGGKDELDAARAAVGFLGDRTRTSDGTRTVAVRPVTGLGDEAFVVAAGFMPMLHVRLGDRAVAVEAGGLRDEQLVAIARKLLERLK